MRDCKKIAFALLGGLLLLPAAAQAQRKSPLADAPAVRNRVELRAKRAELGVGMGTSLDQDFYHAVLLNVRAGFHFNDWIGLGGFFALNTTPNFKTGFHEELGKVLGDSSVPGDKAPTRSDADKSMNKIGQILALQLEVTPFSGKYSLFGKLPLSYDFYGYAGPGFINLTVDPSVSACQPAGINETPNCGIAGFKPGFNFGIGMHTFINQWFAINAELRDVLIRNNPAGRDVNGDKNADNLDITWDSNYMLTLGITILLPTSASVTN